MLHGHHATHLKCLARSWENCFENIRCAPRTLFVGKVGLKKKKKRITTQPHHIHTQPKKNRKKNRVVEMHGGQTKQDQHQQPKKHSEQHVSLCRSKCCPHLDTTATVKHSTRHAQQQSHKIPNNTMQDQNRTFLCYFSATNRRTLAFSKQIATSHGKCLLRHWLRQDVASSAFF